MKFGLLFFIYNLVIKIYVFFLSLLKVKKNRILLHQFFKYGYDCNQKYIAEEIFRRNCKYDLIWVTMKDTALGQKYPSKLKVITTDNVFKLLYYFATSKCCITNVDFYLKKYNLKKKREQIYINTWHGSLGIKKIGLNEKDKLNKKKIFNKYDLFISNSAFETSVYKYGLCFENKIYELGHPRNDIFFKESYYFPNKDSIKNDIEEFSNVKIGNKKLVLYAPTFREDNCLDCFNMDYELLLKCLEKKYNSDFILAIKFHPRISFVFRNIGNKKNSRIINLTKYNDMQGLMAFADIMVTDYSSCIFDYMLSRKPAFIYANDIEKYNNERGFFYPIETTPFPIITNNNEISEKILNFDYNEYRANVEKFLGEKGCIEDGFASERVVDLIENYMESEG